MSLTIQEFLPTDTDYARVGDALTAFTTKKMGAKPSYSPLAFAFNVVSDDKILGTVIAQLIWQTEVEVSLLHVEEAARGQGIGAQLMQKVEEKARALGASGMKLWTPSFQGDGFYQKLGFQELAKLPLNVEYNGKPQYHHLFYKPL